MIKRLAILAIGVLVPQLITEFATPTTYIRSDKLFKQILKNQPTIEANYAVRLSNAILDASMRHRVNPHKIAAILAQECRYRLNCINKVTKDYGIGQINHKTIKAFNMDQKRLLTDLEYSVEMAVIVLADFKRMYGKREKDWFTRYNSSKPDKRKHYGELIARFM